MGAGASNGNSFSPNKLPNLSLWLRSDLGITLNGSNVSSWADQSGNGRDFTQGTAAAQPAYVSSGGAKNRPYLDFDGVNDYLYRASGWSPTGAQTVIIVFKTDAAPSPGVAAGILGISDAGTGQIDIENIVYSGYTEYNFRFSYGANLVGFSPLDFTNYSRWVISYNGSGSATPGNYTMYKEGASFGSLIASGGSAAFPAGAGIGFRLDTGVNFFDGKILEIIIYSDQKTGTDLANLVAYIESLYA